MGWGGQGSGEVQVSDRSYGAMKPPPTPGERLLLAEGRQVSSDSTGFAPSLPLGESLFSAAGSRAHARPFYPSAPLCICVFPHVQIRMAFVMRSTQVQVLSGRSGCVVHSWCPQFAHEILRHAAKHCRRCYPKCIQYCCRVC